MNTQRLLQLADLLETVPEERFDMHDWVGHDWKGDATLSCGTSACAVGWATTLPAFRKQGFYLNSAGPTIIFNTKTARHGKEYFGWEAVEKFFGIVDEEAHHLFGSDPDPFEDDHKETPKEVAQRIRNFVRQSGGAS